MNERLRKMTRYGILRRTVFGEKPPLEVEYALTSLGRRFMGILDEVRRLQEAVDTGAISASAESQEDGVRSGRLVSRIWTPPVK